MRVLVLSILLLLNWQTSLSNINWQYRNTRDGITLIAAGGYDDSVGNQKLYDAFLKLLIERTKGSHRNYNILLLLDQSILSFRAYPDWCGTIAFDTLRVWDYEFIEAYGRYRMGRDDKEIILSRNYPSDKYIYDLPEPIDINSSFDAFDQEVGLKIIYEYGPTDSITFFDRILTLVKYGIENIEEIKNNQKRITMKWDNTKMRVSLLTIDTGYIKSIPLVASRFNHKAFYSSNNQESNNYRYSSIIIWCGILVLIGIVYSIRKGRS